MIFETQKTFQKAVLYYIASQELTKEEERESGEKNKQATVAQRRGSEGDEIIVLWSNEKVKINLSERGY